MPQNDHQDELTQTQHRHRREGETTHLVVVSFNAKREDQVTEGYGQTQTGRRDNSPVNAKHELQLEVELELENLI